jgi:exo-beta-1,3-glucanase (GH17 family)
VSYAPFRHPGVNPFNPQAQVSPAQIETDLQLLKARTACVRTYGLSQGLDAVPAVAARLGMRVKLGVWLSRDTVQNQVEVDRGIALARQFPGVVDMLIVGNEVLLRRELTAQALGQVLDYARQRASVPVTYADVWEFWLRHAALARHVDVVTVHILPYWEDDPVAVKDAVAHVFAVAAKVQRHFSGQAIWVGETGWPAAGRQRGGAVPGRVEQTLFLRELMHATRPAGSGSALPAFNVIEAFDQPWKRSFEGAMGGYWGLFDQYGQARVAFSGPVMEDAHWWRGWAGAAVGALLGAVLALCLYRLGNAGLARWRWAVLGSLNGATLGALAPLQWVMAQQWDRTAREVGVSATLALLGLAVSIGWPLCALLRGSAHPEGPGAAHGVANTRTLTAAGLRRLEQFDSFTRLALLFAATTAALVLLLDARYRPFPWWWFLAPAATLLALRVSSWARPQDGSCSHAPLAPSARARVLAVILAVCAVGVVVAEGPHNRQAWAYGGLLLVLATAAGWPSRTQASTASKAAGAHNSVL